MMASARKLIDALTEAINEPSLASFSPLYLCLRQGRGGSAGGFLSGASLALGHELQHWSDFAGTGAGAFLLSADVVIYDVLFHLLQRERLGKDADTFARMLSEKTGLYPPFEGPRQDQPKFAVDSALFTTGFTFLRQKLSTNALSGRAEDRWKYRHVLREGTFQELVWAVWQLFGVESEDDPGKTLEEIRALFPLPLLSMQPRHCWTTELTTHSITECLAFLNETAQDWLGQPKHYGILQFLGIVTRDRVREALDTSWENLFANPDSEYALCIDYAGRAWSSLRKTDALQEFAPSLAACCDLALHAPLPPLAMPERPVGWDDIHPPSRFLRLIQAVQRSGLLEAERFPQDAAWNSYCAGLLHEAGLPRGVPGPLFSPAATRRLGQLAPDGIPKQPMHIYEYLGLVFRAFAEYRTDHALGRTFVALAPSPTGAATGQLGLLSDFGRKTWFLYPPLQEVNGQAILHPLLPRVCTRSIAEQVLTRGLMLAVMSGAGEFDLSKFPDETFVNHSDHLHGAVRSFVDQVGFPELARWPVKTGRG